MSENDMSRFLRAAVERPPYHFTPRSFQTRPDQNPPRHQDVDPLIKQEMRSPIVTRDIDPLSVFPYRAFPQDFRNPKRHLGQTPFEVLGKLLGVMAARTLYLDGQWQYSSGSEQSVAKVFEQVLSCAYKAIGEVPGVHWRPHTNSMGEGARKPDVILVPNGFEDADCVPASAMYAYCEVKQSSSPSMGTMALLQMIEQAGLVMTSQIGRRFYICLSLCGRQLTLGCFIRGHYSFTRPFDIDDDPKLFLHILLCLSAAADNHIWTGFGEKPKKGGLTYERPIDLSNDVVAYTKFPLFRSFGISGKGTVASAVVYDHLGSDKELEGVLKESWVLEDWPDDIKINMELNRRTPASIPGEDEQVFGSPDKFGVFSQCEKLAPEVDWDPSKHLPGIPITTEWKIATHWMPKELPHDTDEWAMEDSYVLEPDTTKNITKRFRVMKNSKSKELHYEPRKHIYVLCRSHGIPIQYFSCRKELLNAFMCVVIAHYNGIRKGILHCDVSVDNVWIRIVSRVIEKAIPDLQPQAPLRAGMLGDWGSAIDLAEKGGSQKLGAVTGTLPYMATELLSEAGRVGKLKHTVLHDLESIFWVLWSLSVTQAGPYDTLREWADPTQVKHTGTSPATPIVSASPDAHTATSVTPVPIPTTNLPEAEAFTGHTRRAKDANNYPVPAWLTDGNNPCTSDEVYLWKTSANEDHILKPVSPYFLQGAGGTAFRKGIQKLYQYFKPQNSPCHREKITHLQFIEILRDMRNAINLDEDIPTAKVLQAGRERYTKWLQDRQQFVCRYAPPTNYRGSTGKRARNSVSSVKGKGNTQKRSCHAQYGPAGPIC